MEISLSKLFDLLFLLFFSSFCLCTSLYFRLSIEVNRISNKIYDFFFSQNHKLILFKLDFNNESFFLRNGFFLKRKTVSFSKSNMKCKISLYKTNNCIVITLAVVMTAWNGISTETIAFDIDQVEHMAQLVFCFSIRMVCNSSIRSYSKHNG